MARPFLRHEKVFLVLYKEMPYYFLLYICCSFYFQNDNKFLLFISCFLRNLIVNK